MALTVGNGKVVLTRLVMVGTDEIEKSMSFTGSMTTEECAQIADEISTLKPKLVETSTEYPISGGATATERSVLVHEADLYFECADGKKRRWRLCGVHDTAVKNDRTIDFSDSSFAGLQAAIDAGKFMLAGVVVQRFAQGALV